MKKEMEEKISKVLKELLKRNETDKIQMFDCRD